MKRSSGNNDASEAAATLGSRGGKARAKALSPAARKQIAQTAANARWANNKKTAAKRPKSKP